MQDKSAIYKMIQLHKIYINIITNQAAKLNTMPQNMILIIFSVTLLTAVKLYFAYLNAFKL